MEANYTHVPSEILLCMDELYRNNLNAFTSLPDHEKTELVHGHICGYQESICAIQEELKRRGQLFTYE